MIYAVLFPVTILFLKVLWESPASRPVLKSNRSFALDIIIQR